MLRRLLQSLSGAPRRSATALPSELIPPRPSAPEHQILAEGSAAFKSGKVREAIATLHPVIAFAEDPATHALYAHCLVVTGDFEAAHNALREGLKAHPTASQLLKVQAMLFEHLGDAYGAFTSYFRRIQLEPDPKVPLLTTALRALAQASPEAQMSSGKELTAILDAFERQEPRAGKESCVEFAEWLFRIKPFQNKAIEVFQRNTHAAPIVTLNWISAKEATRQGHARSSLDPAENDKPRFLTLHDAGVLPSAQWVPWLPDHRLIIGNFVTRRIRTRREEAASALLLNADNLTLLHRPAVKVRRITEPTVLMGGYDNYYHFVIEHIGRLAALDDLPIQRDKLLWLLPEKLADYQKTYLQLLEIPEHRWLRVEPDTEFRFDQLIAPIPLARGGRHISPHLPGWLRKTFSSKTPRTTGRRRLYLSRKLTQRRTVLNEDVVVSLLVQFGFECIYPETLSVPEQIALFSMTTDIVAPSGAALTNMVFMPAGGTVAVFYTEFTLASPVPLFFDKLSDACGHQFQQIKCTTDTLRSGRPTDADFTVDLESLSNYLRALPALGA